MASWPFEIFDRLPLLFNTLSQYREDLEICFAAIGDAGGALGTALFIWHQLLDNPREVGIPDGQSGSLLGPSFSNTEISRFLDRTGAVYWRIDDDGELADGSQAVAVENRHHLLHL